MKDDVIKNLLISAGAAIEAALSLMEEEGEAAKEQQGPCCHPKDRRKDVSGMGATRFQCLECNEVITEGEEVRE